MPADFLLLSPAYPRPREPFYSLLRVGSRGHILASKGYPAVGLLFSPPVTQKPRNPSLPPYLRNGPAVRFPFFFMM